MAEAFVARLALGQIVITANAASVLRSPEVALALRRHAAKDWGHLAPEDWTANDMAVKEGTRVLSSYQTEEGVTFWIITEADRSVTTLMLPEDY